MKRGTARWRVLAGLLLLGIVALPGCSDDALNSSTAARLRGVSNLYLECAIVGNQRRGPDSEKAFRKHLRGLPDFILKQNALDPNSIDAPIISERDQEPIVIRYGVAISEIGAEGAPLIAHEKNGKNGKRLIVFVGGRVELADEERFQELISDNP